eukprot:Gb_37499 [translate_table: standard]
MSGKDEKVKVFTLWLSPYSNRVLIALEEFGIAYESQEEDMSNKSEQLLKANPIHQKVPALIHNGKSVCESLIILEYIDETWSSAHKSILPSDPYDRAVARFWADFAENKFWNAGRRILWTKGEAQEEAKKECAGALVLMEGAFDQISSGKPYLGGHEFGYLDIVFVPFICFFHAFEALGDFKLPLEKCPKLSAWIKLVSERHSALSPTNPCMRIDINKAKYTKSSSGEGSMFISRWHSASLLELTSFDGRLSSSICATTTLPL